MSNDPANVTLDALDKSNPALRNPAVALASAVKSSFLRKALRSIFQARIENLFTVGPMVRLVF